MKLAACSSPPNTTATSKDTNANAITKKTSFTGHSSIPNIVSITPSAVEITPIRSKKSKAKVCGGMNRNTIDINVIPKDSNEATVLKYVIVVKA